MRAWREADYRNQLRRDEIADETGPGIAGSAFIGELLHSFPIVSDAQTVVDTRAEFALLEAVLQLGVPRPRTNRPLRLPGATYLPDQHHVDVGLIVEVDGGVHLRPARQAADRARDRHMRRHGLKVLRFSNEDLEADVLSCARQVADRRRVLGQTRRSPTAISARRSAPSDQQSAPCDQLPGDQ